mmetsp:Transcript_4428/g.6508  ORF Transcript_4428/g.6508 Transcript_4428/m.6508 type:complete len:177 (+) Transcript_4428:1038-1568(+)
MIDNGGKFGLWNQDFYLQGFMDLFSESPTNKWNERYQLQFDAYDEDNGSADFIAMTDQLPFFKIIDSIKQNDGFWKTTLPLYDEQLEKEAGELKVEMSFVDYLAEEFDHVQQTNVRRILKSQSGVGLSSSYQEELVEGHLEKILMGQKSQSNILMKRQREKMYKKAATIRMKKKQA